jgi:hypothetical protein
MKKIITRSEKRCHDCVARNIKTNDLPCKDCIKIEEIETELFFNYTKFSLTRRAYA